MSLEEPVIVSVVTVEEVSFVVDVVTPPAVSSAVDVTIVEPAATVVVDVVPGGNGGVITFEETGFVVDVTETPLLSAIDVTIDDPLAAIVVDIPGSFEDEVIGGKITIASTAPSSPAVNDVWIDTA